MNSLPLGHILPAAVPRSMVVGFAVNELLIGVDFLNSIVIVNRQTGKKLVISADEMTAYAERIGLNQFEEEEIWPETLEMENAQ